MYRQHLNRRSDPNRSCRCQIDVHMVTRSSGNECILYVCYLQYLVHSLEHVCGTPQCAPQCQCQCHMSVTVCNLIFHCPCGAVASWLVLSLILMLRMLFFSIVFFFVVSPRFPRECMMQPLDSHLPLLPSLAASRPSRSSADISKGFGSRAWIQERRSAAVSKAPSRNRCCTTHRRHRRPQDNPQRPWPRIGCNRRQKVGDTLHSSDAASRRQWSRPSC